MMRLGFFMIWANLDDVGVNGGIGICGVVEGGCVIGHVMCE